MVLVLTMPSLTFALEPPTTPVPAKIVISDGPSPVVATATTVVTLSVAHPFGLFPIYTDMAPHRTNYVPSGYMGDNDLSLSGANVPTPHGKGPCLRVNYKASGPKGWSGVYWQNPANNWGDRSGRAGYDLRGATKLTFWARGEKGGERVHEFRVGGIVGQYPDSDVANITNVRLTKDWKEYSIDLANKDLRHIIGGFGLFVNKFENSGGAVVYLDDIAFVGPQGAAAGSIWGEPPLGQATGQTSAATAVAPALPAVPTPVKEEVAKDLVVKEEAAGLKVSFSSRLQFQTGQAVLDPASSRVLDQLVSLLNTYPTNHVLIEGHTDNTGDKHFNLRLSELRAKAIRDYLLKHGYAESRFKVIGYGDTKPIADNGTKAGRSLNRRVEVTILKETK